MSDYVSQAILVVSALMLALMLGTTTRDLHRLEGQHARLAACAMALQSRVEMLEVVTGVDRYAKPVGPAGPPCWKGQP